MEKLSIIICSRTERISAKLENNIEQTIGCNYELIVINNSQNQYSIFEAYNLGIKQSKGNYLCFMHDDIYFHTKMWGAILVEIFNTQESVGLIGVAGANVKTAMPCAWWRCPLENRFVNIIQHTEHSPIENFNIGFKGNQLERVVVIDGVFMGARRIEGIRFDENLSGFHNYDLNLSFEYIKRNYHICVTNKILIEHLSSGNMDGTWIDSTYAIHETYKSFLPLSIHGKRFDKHLEIANAKRFIKKCLRHRKLKIAFFTWLSLFRSFPFLKYHFKFWVNYMLKLW